MVFGLSIVYVECGIIGIYIMHKCFGTNILFISCSF